MVKEEERRFWARILPISLALARCSRAGGLPHSETLSGFRAERFECHHFFRFGECTGLLAGERYTYKE